jgi:formylglycine-generating enzyme required for sulfatase activity
VRPKYHHAIALVLGPLLTHCDGGGRGVGDLGDATVSDGGMLALDSAISASDRPPTLDAPAVIDDRVGEERDILSVEDHRLMVVDIANSDASLLCGIGESPCEGICVSVARDVRHCGACDHACSTAHTEVACVAGTCQTVRCEEGYADCDGSTMNGCEVNLRSDPSHCGTCTNECPVRRFCTAGACTGEQRSCPAAGERGCGLVEITGGTFTQGDAMLLPEMYASPVQPMITVSDFAVDAYEVTVGRFRRFWDAGHPDLTADVPYPGGPGRWILGEYDRVTEPDNEPALGCDWSRANVGREFLPLVCIDAATAQCFCVWDGGRLATESEWEYLAKARPIEGFPTPRRYPWGNHTEKTQCVVAQFGILCPGARELGYGFREVGSYPPIGGIYDLAGNVEELTASRLAEYWEPSVWGGIPRMDPFAPAARNSLGRFVFRGGGFWEENFNRMNTSSRRPLAGDQRGGAVGFRCVRSRSRS